MSSLGYLSVELVMKRLFRRSFSVLVGAMPVLLIAQQALTHNSATSKISVFLPESIFAQLINSPVSNARVDEVWQIVNQNYILSSFNSQDWDTIRQQFLQQSYDSNGSLYRSIQKTPTSLGDPPAQFIPSEKFRAMQTSSDSLVGVDLQSAQDPQTNELVIVNSIENSPVRKAEILPGGILANISRVDMEGIRIEETLGRFWSQFSTFKSSFDDKYDDGGGTASEFEIFVRKFILAIIFIPLALYISAYFLFVIVMLLFAILSASLDAITGLFTYNSRIQRHKSKNKHKSRNK